MPGASDGLQRRENVVLAFYKDDAGIWCEKYTGPADRAEAKRLRQQFLEELSAGKLTIDMGDWCLQSAVEWRNEFRRPRIAEANRALRTVF